jgi:nucleotide-binding universal stress UspA family protein
MKKTIVVPIDFSGASVNAANYAIDFAIAIKASVALVYVCDLAIISEAPVSAETITNMIEDAEKNIGKLKEGLDHKTGNKINISTEIREGTIIAQLKEYCQDIQPVMVIMGARGTNAAERFLFGSNSLSAMRNLVWPLIIVPNGTRFTGISKIGLACDLQNAQHTVHPEEIKFLLNEFHPELHVLNITTTKHGLLGDDEIKGVEWLEEMLKEADPVFHFMQNENIEEAIKEFSEKNNLNLLIVIPKTRDWFSGLFHKSHSKEMVLHTHIPVMSIHE